MVFLFRQFLVFSPLDFSWDRRLSLISSTSKILLFIEGTEGGGVMSVPVYINKKSMYTMRNVNREIQNLLMI
jgi:hypothetical protein